MVRTNLKQMLSHLRKDAARYEELGGWHRNSGFWAGAVYRLGNWGQGLPRATRFPVRFSYRVANSIVRLLLNVHISPAAEIGPGLCLIHGWNVLIGPSRIGENCLIFHEVTLGSNVDVDVFPEIGKNVDIYVGARVLGGIHVGDDAKIGANTVVTSSVPKGATVVPAANRVISAAAVAAFGPRRVPEPESERESITT